MQLRKKGGQSEDYENELQEGNMDSPTNQNQGQQSQNANQSMQEATDENQSDQKNSMKPYVQGQFIWMFQKTSHGQKLTKQQIPKIINPSEEHPSGFDEYKEQHFPVPLNREHSLGTAQGHSSLGLRSGQSNNPYSRSKQNSSFHQNQAQESSLHQMNELQRSRDAAQLESQVNQAYNENILAQQQEDSSAPKLNLTLQNKLSLFLQSVPSQVIPSSATWFDPDTVHEIEFNHFPEFFLNVHLSTAQQELLETSILNIDCKYSSLKKTPLLYRKIRNLIIELYHQNSKSYLSSTQCRKHIPADAGTIVRIHAFLEKWGLVNFMSDNDIREQNLNTLGSMKTSVEQLDAKLTAINRSQEFLNEYNIDKSASFSNQTLESIGKQFRPLCESCGARTQSNWYQRPLKEAATSFEQYTSSYYQGENLEQHNNSLININSQVQPQVKENLILCERCFSDGKYPAIFLKDSFNQMNVQEVLKAANRGKKEWTLDETKLLLSLIGNLSNGNLNQIFSQFDNRTPEEVVYQFLMLPYLNITDRRFIFPEHNQKNELTLNQMQEVESLQSQQPTVFNDETTQPYMKHVGAFSVLSQNRDLLTQEEKEVLQDTEGALISNAGRVVSESTKSIKEMLGLMLDIQLKKLEFKMTFIDEFQKFNLHQEAMVHQMQHQVLADALKVSAQMKEVE